MCVLLRVPVVKFEFFTQFHFENIFFFGALEETFKKSGFKKKKEKELEARGYILEIFPGRNCKRIFFVARFSFLRDRYLIFMKTGIFCMHV